MAEPSARTRRAKSFRFSRVHRCKIHPGIGIARVGNSPAGFFIGPEAPIDPRTVSAPDGSFKDAEGYIKRQAARFRIYAYDKDGKNLGELPLMGAKHKKNAQAARVVWKVHLANKKGAWYKFTRPESIRNSDVPVEGGKPPDSRLSLIIDPGPRWISGDGPIKRSGMLQSTVFDTGTFRRTPVLLGELKVDEEGRLIVLGGMGKSASTKPDNPIGSDPTRDDFWANNDYWYDDISDGPITAVVTLPNGKEVTIDRPEDSAWVIVAPPKYAPGIYPIVTLYDVMREAAIDAGWIRDDPAVVYFRDIYPVLSRAADFSWVSQEAQRGHGYDKSADFRVRAIGVQPYEEGAAESGAGVRLNVTFLASNVLSEPSQKEKQRREWIFRVIRNPKARGREATEQATSRFMPPLSGDYGSRTEGDPKTWLSLLPSQYRKFRLWKEGKFTAGAKPKFPALQSMTPDDQVEALQRAALEPCIGGAFYPGIEAPAIVRNKDLYVGPFRIDAASYRPGDITKHMCVPWQADFYDCKDAWWPAARPDDVIPQDVFEEANKAWRLGQPPLAEALEGRVKWDRGLGVTTLFRRPWHNPAEAVDDPRDSERRGCDDMVRYWHELGFVLPRKTPWEEAKSQDSEIVHVEMERRPHAGMDVRELFHCLLNIEENRSCLPKVREFVESVLAAARELQKTADSFAWMDNIRPFKYEEAVFDARMKDIYDDCADFAFSEKIDGVRERYDPNDPSHNPYFRTRENVIERIRQLTPFNFLDGSWLRNVHRVGPVDEVNALLFTILKEELGDGVPSQNHANIYRDLCHSFGFYPPPINSMAFARDPAFLDCAFDSPVFQLGISEFSRHYYPEIIGMSLWLEWTVMELHRISSIVERVDLSSHFYRMHIAIDNAASGHGAAIIRAVKLYLSQVHAEGGDQALQEHWKRIWDGYVAFAYTFVVVIKQIMRVIQSPLDLESKLVRLIREKATYGQYNHGNRQLGGTAINSWFSDPEGFLMALQRYRYILPGKPAESPFFKLLEFRGPMYHVFTEEEIKLWRDWTLELGRASVDEAENKLRRLRETLSIINLDLADAIPDARLKAWQTVAADHRIVLWFETAIFSALERMENQRANQAMRQRKSRSGSTRYHATDRGRLTREQINEAKRSIEMRYQNWLGWGVIRAATCAAAQYRDVVKDLKLNLSDPDTGRESSIVEWFDRIREAANSAASARALLMSLRETLRSRPELRRELLAPDAPLSYAFGSGVPGNDGRRAVVTLRAWLDADFVLPTVPDGRVRPLRLDATLNEEEGHPTGVVMGFGTVH
jgi:hypothetical protein